MSIAIWKIGGFSFATALLSACASVQPTGEAPMAPAATREQLTGKITRLRGELSVARARGVDHSYVDRLVGEIATTTEHLADVESCDDILDDSGFMINLKPSPLSPQVGGRHASGSREI